MRASIGSNPAGLSCVSQPGKSFTLARKRLRGSRDLKFRDSPAIDKESANLALSSASAPKVADPENGGFRLLGSTEQPKLDKRLRAIVKTILFDDLSIFELQYRDAGEVHLPTGVGRQAAGE
jgi:hypothetical protein